MTTTLVPIYDPIAAVIQSNTGAAYDVYSVNAVTGVVTSTILSAAAVALLQERMQKIIPLLPGLSVTALKALVRNLVLIDQLEGTFTATVTQVSDDYTLGVSGLATPSNLQVSVPFSEVSPFGTGVATSGAAGGNAYPTILGPFTITTTNNTPTSLTTIPFSAGQTQILEATAIGKVTIGASAGLNIGTQLVQTFVANGANLVQILNTAATIWRQSGTAAVLLWANGLAETGLARLYVAGAASNTIEWTVYVRVLLSVP